MCTDTGDWVGDILDAGPGGSWWGGDPGAVGRYHVGLIDTACRASHRHTRPADHQVIAKMAQARNQRASIPLRVLPVR